MYYWLSLSTILSTISLYSIIILIAIQTHVCTARQLTQQDFDDIIGSDYYLFIKYFAPWCGHCQKLAPIWDKLEAKILSFQTSRVIIGKVDCTEERDLCSRESVMGYPTLKLYKSQDRNGIEYEGERDLLSLETYLRTQLGERVVDGSDGSDSKSETGIETPKAINGLHELNDENIEDFLNRGRHFVDFYAPWCGHCQQLAPTWEQLAESFQFDTSVKISKIDCTANSLSCKHFEIKGYPTLLWIVDGKVTDKYQGMRSHEDLKQFVTNKKNEENIESDKVSLDLTLDHEEYGPLIITEHNFAKTIGKDYTFVWYWVPWCSHCRKLKTVWDQLANKFFGFTHVKIAKVDCAQHESLLSLIHI